jgi:hypothetical protein
LPEGIKLTMVGTSRPSLIPVVEREVDADAAGQRQKMHHRIGRAADRAIGADGVFECLPGQDV